MGKENQIIMVVNRQELFGTSHLKNCPQGFLNADDYDFTPKINFGFKWMKRGDAESNSEYKQPIAYSVIVNPLLNKVFAYKRAIDKKSYHESRLAGNWSWGIGGHIEKLDSKKLVNLIKNAHEIIINSRDRELSEEIEIKSEKPYKIKLLGYINDDSNNVGQVHLGLLYIVETDADKIIPDDKEIAEGGYKTLRELEDICMQAKTNSSIKVDSWSEIALLPIRSFLG